MTRFHPGPGDPPVPALLEGYYADPHLSVFDGRYYLYPTTDGSEGWQATSFRAFSSPDLADWTDHGVVFSLQKDTRWAREHMAAYKVPKIVEFVDSLPKSGSGKVMWRLLQDEEAARSGAGS